MHCNPDSNFSLVITLTWQQLSNRLVSKRARLDLPMPLAPHTAMTTGERLGLRRCFEAAMPFPLGEMSTSTASQTSAIAC